MLPSCPDSRQEECGAGSVTSVPEPAAEAGAGSRFAGTPGLAGNENSITGAGQDQQAEKMLRLGGEEESLCLAGKSCDGEALLPARGNLGAGPAHTWAKPVGRNVSIGRLPDQSGMCGKGAQPTLALQVLPDTESTLCVKQSLVSWWHLCRGTPSSLGTC